MTIVRWLFLGLWLIATPAVAALDPGTIAQLADNDFAVKIEAVKSLMQQDPAAAEPILRGVLAGTVHFRRSDNRIVFVAESESGLQITDVLTGESLGTGNSRDTRRIALNNALRRTINNALAVAQFRHPEPRVRLQAVQSQYRVLDADLVALITELRAIEIDEKVKAAMDVALSLNDLQSNDPVKQMAAIDRLQNELDPTVYNRLSEFLQQTENETTKAALQKAIAQIDQQRQFYGHLETLFFGLSLGSILVLSAIGLAITFGVMGVINMAHGELIMLGAYTTYVMQQLLPQFVGISVILAIPAAFLVSALCGILIQQLVLRFLAGRPLETLLATFGISLILQQAVRTIFSPLNRSVETPAWMAGSLEINSVLSLTMNRLYILLFCLLVFAALLLVLKRTALGLQVRAVSQNRKMATAMGVRSGWVDAMTFGLGSGIAGVAGVALSQLTNVGPNLGQAYIIDSFMVVVFGGVGNLWGTLIGGMGLGIANKFLEPWSGAVLAKILILVFIILFIQKRPRGLFPQKGRAVES